MLYESVHRYAGRGLPAARAAPQGMPTAHAVAALSSRRVRALAHPPRMYACAQAMFHAHRSSRSTPEQLVCLWQHECARIFQDRIVDLPTRSWFETTLHKVSRQHLPDFCPEAPPRGDAVQFVTFASRAGVDYEAAEWVKGGEGGRLFARFADVPGWHCCSFASSTCFEDAVTCSHWCPCWSCRLCFVAGSGFAY